MALSSEQKSLVFGAFIKIVKDPDSLFNFFVPNTKAQMVALIEAQLDLDRANLVTTLGSLEANKLAQEASLNQQIAVIDDLKTQI